MHRISGLPDIRPDIRPGVYIFKNIPPPRGGEIKNSCLGKKNKKKKKGKKKKNERKGEKGKRKGGKGEKREKNAKIRPLSAYFFPKRAKLSKIFPILGKIWKKVP